MWQIEYWSTPTWEPMRGRWFNWGKAHPTLEAAINDLNERLGATGCHPSWLAVEFRITNTYSDEVFPWTELK